MLLWVCQSPHTDPSAETRRVCTSAAAQAEGLEITCTNPLTEQETQRSRDGQSVPSRGAGSCCSVWGRGVLAGLSGRSSCGCRVENPPPVNPAFQ